MVHNLIILDREEGYAKRFAGYINTLSAFPFEARYFVEYKQMEDYSKKNDIDIILATQEMINTIGDIKCNAVIELSDDNVGNITKSGCIYKYQSCEMIIKQILYRIAENPNINKLVIRKNPMRIIGFYSPIKRIGQTRMAIIMGQLLAEKVRTLYINLEANSGLEELLDLEFGSDMSDLMYDIKNGHKEIAATIGSNVHRKGNLEIFPVMRDYRDLFGMTFSEWKELLKKLETDTDYEYVLLDISDGIQGIDEILKICNRIYMVKCDDMIATAKMNQYMDNADEEFVEDIKDKIVSCVIPECKNMTSVSLWGTANEIGDYCQSIIRDDGLI